MSDSPNAFEPFRVWREWAKRAEEQLAANLNATAAAGQLGSASQQMMEAFTGYQDAMREASEQFFRANDPSGQSGKGATSLADRLESIEARLTTLEDGPQGAADPFRHWREWTSQAEKQLAQNLKELSTGEQFGAATRQMLEMFTNYQEGLRKAAESYVALNRTASPAESGEGLADHFQALEKRLAKIERKLSE